MEQEQKRMGRPPGKQAWRQRTLLLTDLEDGQIRRLAAKRRLSVAATIRQIIREQAKREGLENGQHPPPARAPAAPEQEPEL